MKKFLSLFLLCMPFASCNHSTQDNKCIQTHLWECHFVNDTTILCIPVQNGESQKPYIMYTTQAQPLNNDLEIPIEE